MYIVDFEWIVKWASFVKDKNAVVPGLISNDSLMSKLAQNNELMLGKEVVALSFSLWKQFFNKFGGGPCL